ncbi:MAG: tRNA (adenosine(37)-N6)-dimethylallyltransferase MiaA [Candidatus Omnitrophica bacterium]|nr:tRNA (adenosine(37)-N6)-dimethylallyltransferase MiaA [Candidatus Omnitrophota bacterium]
MSKKVLFLVGPTGSGKSKLALFLAKRLRGEIISCDSMQVYRGMDVGTAKPTPKEQRQIPHHLINLISPRAEYSVFKFRAQALQAIKTILARKHLPIIVGGSGLYVKAIVDGIAPQPGKERSVRERLEKTAKKKGVSYLYRQLEASDPESAAKIHSNDLRRIIRALEIFELSRRTKTDWKQETKGLEEMGVQPLMFGLLRKREALYRGIEARIEAMFQAGWVREVQRLKRIGFSKTARAAIGYHEILGYLAGTQTLEDAKSEIKKRTRHLAKRQMTWFGKDKRIHWISVSGENFIQHSALVIRRHFRN